MNINQMTWLLIKSLIETHDHRSDCRSTTPNDKHLSPSTWLISNNKKALQSIGVNIWSILG
jgi:hypothetical protein